MIRGFKTTQNKFFVRLSQLTPYFLRTFFPLALLFAMVSFTFYQHNPFKKVTIFVIDAGHGGKDPGCRGVHSKEKEVTLAVALKLGKLIEEKLKDVKVIYTRKTDVFVELEERAQIANRNNADLFISIHCNAASYMQTITVNGKKKKKEVINTKPYGSETYVMGIKNESGKTNVMKRENAVMLLEDNYKTTYGGFDPNSDESYIMMSMFTETFVEQSGKFAANIQSEYKTRSGRIDKGVKRESLWVLWRTKMPSVLTEIGYLTNPQEENFISSEPGQFSLAASLFRAFRNYKNEIEGTGLKYDDEIEKLKPLTNENIARGDTAYLHQIEDYQNDDDTLDMNPAEKIKSLLADGNRLFAIGDFNGAEKKFTEIKTIESNHKVAAQKLNEIAAVKNKYGSTINKADKLFQEKKYKEAKQEYANAQAMMPKENYPTEQIKRCVDQLEGSPLLENEKEFDHYMKKGNENYTKGNIEEARISYEEALKIKPKSDEAAKKIAQCKNDLEKISNEKNDKYSLLIIQGDSFFRLGKYEEAKAKYTQAVLVDPSEQYPKNKITEIAALLAPKNNPKNTKNDFEYFIHLADSCFSAKNFVSALSHYERSLSISPNDEYAAFQVELTKKTISFHENAVRIKSQIRKGDSLVLAGNCRGAEASFNAALDMLRASVKNSHGAGFGVDTVQLKKKISDCRKNIDSNKAIGSATYRAEFRVQFRQSEKKLGTDHADFSGLKEVWSYELNNFYKYTAGRFYTLEEAVKYKDELKQKGFKDAFVIGVSNGKRIDIKEAQNLLSQQKNQ